MSCHNRELGTLWGARVGLGTDMCKQLAMTEGAPCPPTSPRCSAGGWLTPSYPAIVSVLLFRTLAHFVYFFFVVREECIVDLQRCISFRGITKRYMYISYIYTYMCCFIFNFLIVFSF